MASTPLTAMRVEYTPDDRSGESAIGLMVETGHLPSWTFDRNPKSVQFIQPKVLDRACLSVGKDDGFADQFGLRLTVLLQNF
jgi:hypothetical protein